MEIRLNELKDVIMKDEWQREQQLAAGWLQRWQHNDNATFVRHMKENEQKVLETNK